MSAKELNIGDYVRTKSGEITRITKVCIEGYVNEVYVEDDVYTEYWERKTDCLHIGTDWKSSPNIIDLIEVGDFVKIKNEGWVQVSIKFEVLKFFDNSGTEYLYEEIEAIITKEQLERMEYKIGE